ncbi:MAG: LysM peptidoglycan-binding domain-containing protein [Bacteriovoracaceae bacterium]|jgi:hypothetical protein|nr:LysM peptidoglycan-binding domain-containing protein [Bacteriovoracaceae bacterium]
MIKFLSFLIFLLSFSGNTYSQTDEFPNLELDEESDMKVLREAESEERNRVHDEKLLELDISELEEMDDLEALKGDIGPLYFDEEARKTESRKKALKLKRKKLTDDVKELKERGTLYQEITGEKDDQSGDPTVNNKKYMKDKPLFDVFDVGKEEEALLETAKFIQRKIPEKEWNELSANAKEDHYTVEEGDYLWKIAQKLFGSGFYYPKIWSLNSYITNPHQIEPGMVLIFDTGDSINPPQVTVGSFEKGTTKTYSNIEGRSENVELTMDLSKWGDNTIPKWIKEKEDLIKQGVYVQFSSEYTYKDLEKISAPLLNREYERYSPPKKIINLDEPILEFEDTGFDKSARESFGYKEGFYLNTFVTTNIVQDFGYVDHAQNEGINLHNYDRIYINFDPGLRIVPGDLFSLYAPHGEIGHDISDRSGYKYSIVGQITVFEKKGHLWECEVSNVTGNINRGDRVTVYTPQIDKITKSFNPRNIEAAVIAGHESSQNLFSFGDVVYIDRGRADGVELGNIFEAYLFTDRGTDKQITADPSYKVGEGTVINLTDNFATILVSQSSNEFENGTIMLSKTIEAAARESRIKNKSIQKSINEIEKRGLEELDTELTLKDINDDLLEKADKIQLTEDELDELERQERERSILKGQEKDLHELEKLEKELETAEAQLNEGKLDEDKLLEQEDLNSLEANAHRQHPDSFADLNELEAELGTKYLDEDLSDHNNPYGLSENDLEEIDELLNLDPDEYEKMREQIKKLKKKDI